MFNGFVMTVKYDEDEYVLAVELDYQNISHRSLQI